MREEEGDESDDDILEISVSQGGARCLQPDDFDNPTQITFDLRCVLTRPVVCCRKLRERVSKAARNLIEILREKGNPNPPVIASEWSSAPENGGGPATNDLFEYYTPRALILAHTLLLRPRDGITTLQSFIDGLWDDPEEQMRADQMEDATRIAESSILNWPLKPGDLPAVQNVFEAIWAARSILEVRETGDARGRGLYALKDLGMDYLDHKRRIAPYPGVPTPKPPIGSDSYKQDLAYHIGDNQGIYKSYYHLDRSGTLRLSDIRLPLGQFANEALVPRGGDAANLEVHNAQYTSDGLKLLKPILKGEQILVCYGSDETYARDAWEAPPCCSVPGRYQLASEPVEMRINPSGGSRRRPQRKYLCTILKREEMETEFNKRKECREERNAKRQKYN